MNRDSLLVGSSYCMASCTSLTSLTNIFCLSCFDTFNFKKNLISQLEQSSFRWYSKTYVTVTEWCWRYWAHHNFVDSLNASSQLYLCWYAWLCFLRSLYSIINPSSMVLVITAKSQMTGFPCRSCFKKMDNNLTWHVKGSNALFLAFVSH